MAVILGAGGHGLLATIRNSAAALPFLAFGSRKSGRPRCEFSMFGIGPLQIFIVLLVVLLLFGNRLPMLARSLGASLVEFKKGVKEIDDSKPEDSKQP